MVIAGRGTPRCSIIHGTPVPKGATLTSCKRGVINDPEHGYYDGKPACAKWYEYTTRTGQEKHYIVIWRDGELVLCKQATGRNVAAWRAAYDDMCSVIREQ